MDIRLLGPIEASLDGRPIRLGPRQQRAVLAMLALQLNRTVSTDRLIEGLWDERAPPDDGQLTGEVEPLILPIATRRTLSIGESGVQGECRSV